MSYLFLEHRQTYTNNFFPNKYTATGMEKDLNFQYRVENLRKKSGSDHVQRGTQYAAQHHKYRYKNSRQTKFNLILQGPLYCILDMIWPKCGLNANKSLSEIKTKARFKLSTFKESLYFLIFLELSVQHPVRNYFLPDILYLVFYTKTNNKISGWPRISWNSDPSLLDSELHHK